MPSKFYALSLSAFALSMAAGLTACSPGSNEAGVKSVNADKPNIVVIYVDDLGYGDVGSYGAKGVETPYVDALAAGGLRMTDAHTSAATCTPSRFSLLTGEYAFRSGARVLRGDANSLIKPGRPTLPAMLKKVGYKTAVVGKWHLGLGDGAVDWNTEIKPGPLEIGFDYSFLLPATGDRVPTVYLENHNVVNLDPEDPITLNYQKKVGDRPTGHENPELLRYAADKGHNKTIVNGVSRIGYMAGGESALWVDEEFPDVFNAKAVEFIADNKDNPFFLFYSFHDIHVPRLPHPRFAGKSDMGLRGDAIVQMDWMVGQITKELKAHNIEDNTIVVFTSDNGPILMDGYEDKAVELLNGHKPGGPFRGTKYSIYEAGTRVPTIVHWPDGIKPGVSDALVSQTDLYASFAAMLDVPLAANEAIDSANMLPAFTGKSEQGREHLFYEAVVTVAVREGDWKYIAPMKDRQREPKFIGEKGVESGGMKIAQLYDLSKDPGETNNVVEQYPDVTRRLAAKLAEIKARKVRP